MLAKTRVGSRGATKAAGRRFVPVPERSTFSSYRLSGWRHRRRLRRRRPLGRTVCARTSSNTAPDDHGYNATNGCTTLFIYYLFHQLGFSINQIVAGAAATLADVYRKLHPRFRRPVPALQATPGPPLPLPDDFDDTSPQFRLPWPLGARATEGTGRGTRERSVPSPHPPGNPWSRRGRRRPAPAGILRPTRDEES